MISWEICGRAWLYQYKSECKCTILFFFFFLKALDSTSNYKAWENCNCKILQCVPEAKVWLNCWQTNQKVSSLNIELHRKRIKKMQRLHTEPITELNLKIDSLSFCVQCTFWEQLNTAAKNKGEKRIAKILHGQNYCLHGCEGPVWNGIFSRCVYLSRTWWLHMLS